jgi:hypothetical protein
MLPTGWDWDLLLQTGVALRKAHESDHPAIAAKSVRLVSDSARRGDPDAPWLGYSGFAWGYPFHWKEQPERVSRLYIEWDSPDPQYIKPAGMAANAVIGIAILLLAVNSFEFLLRRREARKP